MDPNSQNQHWSYWTFTIFDGGRRVSKAELEPNAARWLRTGFRSAGKARVSRTVWGWQIEAVVEGVPSHDAAYVASVRREFRERFVKNGFGPMARGTVKVRTLAGSEQDGRPAAQWVEMPTRIEVH